MVLTKKVAVIGGGPVGLFLALKLANQKIGNLHITVYEKGSWPRDKVCGQGIMPEGVRLLSGVGVDFSKIQNHKFSGINYIDDNKIFTGDLSALGVGVERVELSSVLFELASKKSDITLQDKCEVEEIVSENKKYHLIIEGVRQEFDYIFACDGLNSNIRKMVGFNCERRVSNRLGARSHYQVKPWSDCVEVYWGRGVEAYVTPVARDRVEIAYLWFSDSIEKGSNLKERLLNNFPVLKDKISAIESDSDFKAYGPFKTYSRKMAHQNLYFVGDAYKFLDGITGEGLSLGFRSASLIAKNYENLSIITEFKIKLEYLKYALLVNAALILSRKPRLRKMVFGIFMKNKRLFNTILKFNDFSFSKAL